MSEIIQTLSKVKNYNSQKMSEIELLPCPFCGGKAEVRATKRLVFNGKYMGTVHYVVGCIDTKCIGRIQRRYNSIEEAIDAWSTRKTIHRISERTLCRDGRASTGSESQYRLPPSGIPELYSGGCTEKVGSRYE